MLERSWGGYTFLKFIGVTNLCIMWSIFFSMVACYAATEYEPCLSVERRQAPELRV
jgi:hypothetical protein